MHLSPKVFLGILLLVFGVGLGVGVAHFSPTGLVIQPTTQTPSSLEYDSIQSAFCPSPICESLPLSAIHASQSKIDVAMYSFTHPQLAQALMDAHERGVVVRVLLERQQAGGSFSQLQNLRDAGLSVRIDANPSYMHHKFAVIDQTVVLTGSMNWSRNGVGENNENVLVIHSTALNARFAQEFETLWHQSENN
ncbi:MAG: phospholipase D family protein [Candidatus Diapherotrites archaeon]|nr:phospholipase D family protein [Candidatus Diapherotrites archaeon]MDZ4256042.1 phospholipase D family protein [archaeon]